VPNGYQEKGKARRRSAAVFVLVLDWAAGPKVGRQNEIASKGPRGTLLRISWGAEETVGKNRATGKENGECSRWRPTSGI